MNGYESSIVETFLRQFPRDDGNTLSGMVYLGYRNLVSPDQPVITMMLSKSAEYGIRAALYLSSLENDGYVSIGTISERLDISATFLTKIFQKLTHAGLLRSFRGPRGGVALARSAEEINLYDLYVAIEGSALFTKCVLGLPGCGEREPCPMHAEWADVRGELLAMFTGQTLSELREGIRQRRFRLSETPLDPGA